MVRLGKNDLGWFLEIDDDFKHYCSVCKEEIRTSSTFYYCKSLNKFFCYDCRKEPMLSDCRYLELEMSDHEHFCIRTTRQSEAIEEE